MKNKLSNTGSSWDIIKWIVVLVLVVAGVVANYYYRDVAWSLRLAGWIVLVCVAGGIALTTAIGQRAWGFTKEARSELRKVVWPTRQETVQSTMFVIAMVLVMTFVLWGVDAVLMWAMGYLTT